MSSEISSAYLRLKYSMHVSTRGDSDDAYSTAFKTYNGRKGELSRELLDQAGEKFEALSPDEKDTFLKSLYATAKFDPYLLEGSRTFLNAVLRPNTSIEDSPATRFEAIASGSV